MGIIRNHYVGRTFIEPTQKIRALGVKLKHNANRAVLQGRSVVLIDDSIVRGTTSKKIVQMVREAGAAQVHMRIASPPITHSDYYGIDTPDREQLLAARALEESRGDWKKALAHMCDFVGADSLRFISIDGLYRALGHARRDPEHPQFTDHCFTGDYPTPLVDQEDERTDPKQLPLLADTA